MLMGLIKPTRGTASLFGHPVGKREATLRLGFLPESPYFYEYLSVTELTDLAGRVFGLSKKERQKRSAELIELVGLTHAAKSPLKSYSKGMMQRAGIAQALMNDPELVVLDEPMSGLDPVGRKEVRDIILNLREQGKTVFFSSHILADVEALAERIAIVVKGKVRREGYLSDLVGNKTLDTELTFRCDNASKVKELAHALSDLNPRTDDHLVYTLASSPDSVHQAIERARSAGASVYSVTPRLETLEDVFMRTAEAVEAT
jgi:ABC-2 type transport system ATP-binding protein